MQGQKGQEADLLKVLFKCLHIVWNVRVVSCSSCSSFALGGPLCLCYANQRFLDWASFLLLHLRQRFALLHRLGHFHRFPLLCSLLRLFDLQGCLNERLGIIILVSAL